jgi:hypothetical protein
MLQTERDIVRQEIRAAGYVGGFPHQRADGRWSTAAVHRTGARVLGHGVTALAAIWALRDAIYRPEPSNEP